MFGWLINFLAFSTPPIFEIDTTSLAGQFIDLLNYSDDEEEEEGGGVEREERVEVQIEDGMFQEEEEDEMFKFDDEFEDEESNPISSTNHNQIPSPPSSNPPEFSSHVKRSTRFVTDCDCVEVMVKIQDIVE